jgi:hypothetical protein
VPLRDLGAKKKKKAHFEELWKAISGHLFHIIKAV